MAAIMTWDEEGWHTILTRQHQACREAGWLAPLLITMNGLAVLTVWRGDFAAAASLIAEAETIAAATGTPFVPYAAVSFAGFRGAESEAIQVMEAVVADA